MGRKKLAAILLPVPFAALPVLVVLAGALFGGKAAGEGELVTTKDTPALEQRVSTDGPSQIDESTLARAAQDATGGCDEGLNSEF